MYCAIVVCICTRVIVVLSLCVNVFVSAARSFFFFSTSTKNSHILCLCWSFFWSLTKNSSKRQKPTKLSSDRHILLLGSVRCLHYVCLFLFDHPVDVNEGTISCSVRLVSPCCDRRKTSPRSRGERGGKIILFLRAKKRKLLLPSSSVVVSCDLFFFITTYELYSRGLLGLLLVLFCSFIAFSWFKPSSRRRREESSSLVVPFSLFHSHALSFITLKKQAPSWSVDRSLLQTEDTQFIFVHFLNKVKKRIIKRNVL